MRATLLKSVSNRNLRNLQEHLFLTNTSNGCFCKKKVVYIATNTEFTNALYDDFKCMTLVNYNLM